MKWECDCGGFIDEENISYINDSIKGHCCRCYKFKQAEAEHIECFNFYDIDAYSSGPNQIVNAIHDMRIMIRILKDEIIRLKAAKE